MWQDERPQAIDQTTDAVILNYYVPIIDNSFVSTSDFSTGFLIDYTTYYVTGSTTAPKSTDQTIDLLTDLPTDVSSIDRLLIAELSTDLST